MRVAVASSVTIWYLVSASRTKMQANNLMHDKDMHNLFW